MDQNLTDADVKLVEKIQKLLNLANKNPNEEEAAAAAAKAQEMIEEHGLSMATIDQSKGAAEGRREEKKLKGGQYEYQRDLWRAVAELNFCLYWTQQQWRTREKEEKDPWDGSTYARTVWGRYYTHRIVGRIVNVAATRALAGYLEQTIERLTMDFVHNDNRQRFSRRAVSYREGIADRLCEKIYDRRRELLREEKRKQKEAEKAQRRAARAGVSTETAITIADVTQSERDANNDFLYGEGWSADQRAQAEERARRRAEEEAEYAKWAAANPEEAAAKEAEREKEWKKHSSRYRGGPAPKPRDHGAYYSGYDKGGDVGLDQQTSDRSKSGGLLK